LLLFPFLKLIQINIQQRRMQTDPTQRASIRWDDHQTIRNQKRKPTDTTERNQQPQTRDYQDTTVLTRSLLLFPFLKLIQINIILSDNVHILYIYTHLNQTLNKPESCINLT
jgi:hypothetical protein